MATACCEGKRRKPEHFRKKQVPFFRNSDAELVTPSPLSGFSMMRLGLAPMFLAVLLGALFTDHVIFRRSYWQR